MVIEMLEHHTGMMGGTMRLGSRRTIFKENNKSKISKLHKKKNCVKLN